MAASQPVNDQVLLGFAEPTSDPITREWLPNKIGGKPAWLIPDRLPAPMQLACPKCSLPMWFLLQIYAPLELRDDTYHRALYLFCCKSCATFKVFRTQLPNANPYYMEMHEEEGEEELDDEIDDSRFDKPRVTIIPTAPASPLCDICGCFGNNVCGGCHLARYCSQTHQKFDWNAGHSDESAPAHPRGKRITPGVFPELHMPTETEPDNEEQVPQNIKRRLSELDSSINAEEEADTNSELLEKNMGDFVHFQRRVAREPCQVLRYSAFSEQVLWISDKGRPSADDLDWGTVVVFSCSESCPCEQGECAYVEEFAWKQDCS